MSALSFSGLPALTATLLDNIHLGGMALPDTPVINRNGIGFFLFLHAIFNLSHLPQVQTTL